MSVVRYRTDAEDMLYDIARVDHESRGTISAAKKRTVEIMATKFRRSAEEIARDLELDLKQVENMLEAIYSPALSPR